MSKPTYILDTNVFLRTLIKEDDVSFKACISLLTKIKQNKVEAIVPGIVIAELIWTLRSFYGLSKKETHRAISSVLRLNNLRVKDEYDYPLALELWRKHKSKYIDCAIATLAMKLQLPVVSYDKDFDKLDVTRIDPNKDL